MVRRTVSLGSHTPSLRASLFRFMIFHQASCTPGPDAEEKNGYVASAKVYRFLAPKAAF
jgi:hypothetical protein